MGSGILCRTIVAATAFRQYMLHEGSFQHAIDRVDAIDRRILAALQEDASITNVDLADKWGSRPRLAWRAFARSNRRGDPARVALLDPVKLGAISVFIRVTLEKQTEPVLDRSNPLSPAFPR